MTVGTGHVLAVSAVLLAVGVYGVLARRTVIGTVAGLQLMLCAAGVAFVGFARFGYNGADPLGGMVLALLLVVAGAVQAAVAVALALLVFRRRATADADSLDELGG